MPILNIRLKDRDYQALADLAESEELPVSSLARGLLLRELRRRQKGTGALASDVLDAIEDEEALLLRLRRILLIGKSREL